MTQRGPESAFKLCITLKPFFLISFLQNSALALARNMAANSLCKRWCTEMPDLVHGLALTQRHTRTKAGSEASKVFQVLLVMVFNGQGRNSWPCCSMYQYSKSKEEFSFSYRPDIAYFICVYCSVLYVFFHLVSFWILSDWAAFFYDTSWLFLTLENLL